MYHHFPDGKEQIAIEVVHSISANVMALMTKLDSGKQSLSDILRTLAKGMAQWLRASKWREGTMLATATVGSVPDLPKLHAAIREAFDQWRQQMAAMLEREGWSRPEAATMAQLILATIEGAMIVARVDQDERVLIKVVERLARLVAAGPETD
jgi:TetR/AcrR family transcriptional regulator, lmrAB and yxaGH operons repressor